MQTVSTILVTYERIFQNSFLLIVDVFSNHFQAKMLIYNPRDKVNIVFEIKNNQASSPHVMVLIVYNACFSLLFL